MMPQSVAEFHAICKCYRTGLLRQRPVWALRDVSLSVPRGSVFGVIGPNRSGKTTLVKTLLSICHPTSGSARRLGRPLGDRSTLAAVGYLHESQAFPRYLTATALLEYYSGLTVGADRPSKQRIERLLKMVGLADRAREPIANFSKGMVQRLALAQALVNDPELLVLDEPTEGMDLLARKLLHEVIRRRQREGKTAILVSHSMSDIEQLCDRVAVLREGRVAFDGPIGDLAGNADECHSAESLQDALEPLYAGVSP